MNLAPSTTSLSFIFGQLWFHHLSLPRSIFLTSLVYLNNTFHLRQFYSYLLNTLNKYTRIGCIILSLHPIICAQFLLSRPLVKIWVIWHDSCVTQTHTNSMCWQRVQIGFDPKLNCNFFSLITRIFSLGLVWFGGSTFPKSLSLLASGTSGRSEAVN